MHKYWFFSTETAQQPHDYHFCLECICDITETCCFNSQAAGLITQETQTEKEQSRILHLNLVVDHLESSHMSLMQ